MGYEPKWASHELKVVWEPEHRYLVGAEPRSGYWAVFARDGAEAGILETDGVASLSFEGRGGETDISVFASGLIQQFAAFEYSVRTAFELTRGLVELEYGVTSRLVYGQLPRRRRDDRRWAASP
jgi:hypothetical protein